VQKAVTRTFFVVRHRQTGNYMRRIDGGLTGDLDKAFRFHDRVSAHAAIESGNLAVKSLWDVVPAEFDVSTGRVVR
jgi:hypothetical protein